MAASPSVLPEASNRRMRFMRQSGSMPRRLPQTGVRVHRAQPGAGGMQRGGREACFEQSLHGGVAINSSADSGPSQTRPPGITGTNKLYARLGTPLGYRQPLAVKPKGVRSKTAGKLPEAIFSPTKKGAFQLPKSLIMKRVPRLGLEPRTN